MNDIQHSRNILNVLQSAKNGERTPKREACHYPEYRVQALDKAEVGDPVSKPVFLLDPRLRPSVLPRMTDLCSYRFSILSTSHFQVRAVYNQVLR